MKPFRTAILSAVVATTALPVFAADYSDPTWPCVARKVESLSLGLMWPHPVPEADSVTDEALQSDVADLADALGLRRVELETLRPAVESFAEAYSGDPDALGLVFSRVFESLNKRRSRIISGIGEFSLSQIALADKIDTARLEMDTVLQASAPDFDRADVLEEQLDWDQLIYTDRQRSIQYLCETPQIIERRLFAIAQMLQQVAQK
ncbi:MAG: hypothetical protein AAGC86_03935 [Pseudomonadota bacterium]